MSNMVYDDNWNENNIKDVIEQIENEKAKPTIRMVVPNFGAGVEPCISEESRKICAESLLN